MCYDRVSISRLGLSFFQASRVAVAGGADISRQKNPHEPSPWTNPAIAPRYAIFLGLSHVTQSKTPRSMWSMATHQGPQDHAQSPSPRPRTMFLRSMICRWGPHKAFAPNASKGLAAALRAANLPWTNRRTEHNCHRHRTKATRQFTIAAARIKLKHVNPSFRISHSV